MAFEKNVTHHKLKHWGKMDYDARLKFLRSSTMEREQQREEITYIRERLENLKDPVLNVLAQFDKPSMEMLAI